MAEITLETKVAQYSEFHFVTTFGKEVQLECHMTSFTSQGEPHLLLLMNDITERKRTEEALQQANLVVENSPVVLFRWKAAEGWPVEFVSHNVIQFGYTPEELRSGAILFASMVYPEDMNRVAREVQEYSASGAASIPATIPNRHQGREGPLDRRPHRRGA